MRYAMVTFVGKLHFRTTRIFQFLGDPFSWACTINFCRPTKFGRLFWNISISSFLTCFSFGKINILNRDASRIWECSCQGSLTMSCQLPAAFEMSCSDDQFFSITYASNQLVPYKIKYFIFWDQPDLTISWLNCFKENVSNHSCITCRLVLKPHLLSHQFFTTLLFSIDIYSRKL